MPPQALSEGSFLPAQVLRLLGFPSLGLASRTAPPCQAPSSRSSRKGFYNSLWALSTQKSGAD